MNRYWWSGGREGGRCQRCLGDGGHRGGSVPANVVGSSHCSHGRGKSMAGVAKSWSSNGVVADSDWGLGDGVDGGGVSGDDGLGGVSLHGGVVDVRGLHDLLDGMDLVGSGDWDSPGDGNLVRLGHLGVGDDLTGHSSGHSHGNIHVVLVDLDLGHDVGHLGGDLHVAPHGGGDLLDGDGGGGSDGSGLHDVLGSSDHIGGGWLGDGLLAGHDVLVSTHNSVLHPVLHHGRARSVAVVGLANHGGGRGHWRGHQRAVVGGSSHGDSQEGD